MTRNHQASCSLSPTLTSHSLPPSTSNPPNFSSTPYFLRFMNVDDLTSNGLSEYPCHRYQNREWNPHIDRLPSSQAFCLTHSLDPFEDDLLGETEEVGSQKNNIHIRIQQRNGKKTLTTLQGLGKGTCGDPHLDHPCLSSSYSYACATSRI